MTSHRAGLAMARPMTLKRLRAYTTLVAVTLWSIWVIDFSIGGPLDRIGKVKGTDFLQFYAAGALVHDGRWNELYDAHALNDITRAIAPTSQETLFVPIQSPQMALFFAPLARYPYTVALTIWLAATGLLYACTCGALWKACHALRERRSLVMSSCLACPGFYVLVINGQTTALSLACLVAALLGLRRGQPFAAGLALGLLVFKPQWVAATGAVFLIAREWRVIAGILVAAGAQLALTWLIVGSSVMNAYGRILVSIPRFAGLLEPKPGDSLKSYWELVTPWRSLAWVLYLATALATAIIAAGIWRRHPAFEVRCSALVLAIVLVSPHVLPYDLILLVPVYFFMANWFAEHESEAPQILRVVLIGLFLAPLLTVLPAFVRQQFSVAAAVVALVVLWRLSGIQRTQVAANTHGVAPESSEPGRASRTRRIPLATR